jgi:hypothetical protein
VRENPDSEDAARCCNPEWERQGRPLAFGIEDMDQDGRQFMVTGGLTWVYGWVRRVRPDAADLTRQYAAMDANR